MPKKKKVSVFVPVLETVKEEKTMNYENSSPAAASIQTLMEEKDKLVKELRISRAEEEKSKKALESLASASKVASSEARDAKEKLISFQLEHQKYETKIECMKQVYIATTDKYESMIRDSKKEKSRVVDLLRLATSEASDAREKLMSCQLERGNYETQIEYMDRVLKATTDKYERMIDDPKQEISRLVGLLQVAEEKILAAMEKGENWRRSFKKADADAINLQKLLDKAKFESARLKEDSMDRENELQKIKLENEELRKLGTDYMIKVQALTKQLEEGSAKNKGVENLDPTVGEKKKPLLGKFGSLLKKKSTANQT
ncbi:hypothetical protein ABFS82_06G008200 [Erythranthe guttata]